MPRLILIPDDLEERTRDCCVGAAGLEETFGVLTAYRDLLDASRDTQAARADKHDADHTYNLRPCFGAEPGCDTPTDSIGW